MLTLQWSCSGKRSALSKKKGFPYSVKERILLVRHPSFLYVKGLLTLALTDGFWLSFLEKDVNRTDRTHEYFKGDNNPSLTRLNDILMTYCMYNFDLGTHVYFCRTTLTLNLPAKCRSIITAWQLAVGYVQGMSDLLAPILVVVDNEVDAFWCFAGFMDQVVSIFSPLLLPLKI